MTEKNKSIDTIDVYNNAIDECLEIVKFYKDTWDGIEWAIKDISELKVSD